MVAQGYKPKSHFSINAPSQQSRSVSFIPATTFYALLQLYLPHFSLVFCHQPILQPAIASWLRVTTLLAPCFSYFFCTTLFTCTVDNDTSTERQSSTTSRCQKSWSSLCAAWLVQRYATRLWIMRKCAANNKRPLTTCLHALCHGYKALVR